MNLRTIILAATTILGAADLISASARTESFISVDLQTAHLTIESSLTDIKADGNDRNDTRSDEKSTAILRRLSATLKAYDCYEVRFTVSADGIDDIEGHYLVSGNRYRINVQNEEHISDGKVRYEISHVAKEVIIDNVNASSSNIFTNPSRAFEFAEDQFISQWAGNEIVLGWQLDVIRLRPTAQSYGNISIRLYVDPATGLPAAVKYDHDGQSIDITISEIRKMPHHAGTGTVIEAGNKTNNATFAFNRADYPDYEIIDFR